MNIHILGIAGAMTTPLALALIKQGHTVTGSDQEIIYPPTSDLLRDININKNLPKKIDLCIVGSSYNKFTKTKEEFQYIHQNHIPYISATNFIANNLCQKNSILIAGTVGKTSISSLLAWNLVQANLNPSYFFGGIAINNFPSLIIDNSDYSVVEADESINGLDTKAKFLYYPVKYLILTSASWEHKDSYKTEKDNFEAFKKLIQKIPKDGLLICNKSGVNIKKLIKYCKAPIIYYNNKNEDAVKTFCNFIKIDFKQNFPGIKRRLEIIKNENNIIIVDDFAQSPDRISYTLNTLHAQYPQHKIKVLFEPHASFLKYSIKNIGKSLELSSEVIVSAIKFNKDKNIRITAADYKKEIGKKFIYLPLKSDIINHYHNNLKPFDLLVHFSSGENSLCQNI
jgi:UDP-N-acetylmuramate: L-alanyl-gamma-D-glutamyl-meso-diaminopimelate ligase